ncbi:MAG: class I adenylate-forming enzyme family protein [Chthoniobacterales bacterium]
MNNAPTGAERKVKNAILQRWRDVLERKGDAPAVWLPDGSVARSFSDIESEADAIASKLRELPPGAVVSLQAENCPEWPALLLGIWKTGGCAFLIDHAFGEVSRDAAERICGARVRLGAAGVTLLDNIAADFGDSAPDLIKLTSGTSAAPRAILFKAAQLEADCSNICETMGIGDDDINYGVVAFSHSYGFSSLITPLLCRGVPLVTARDALPRAILAGIAATGATVLPAVPAIFQALSEVDGEVARLRLCISAGAPLRTETGSAFRARFGLKIHTFYGASECGGIAYDLGEDESAVEGFVGMPLRGVSIDSEAGEGILVRSDAVGIGYFPGGADELGCGVFKPADLLEKSARGWRIIGRRTDVINVGGKKTSPQEIENVLLSHPSVREAVAFGVGDGMRTEAVCACVVGEVDDAALRAWCTGKLAAWQMPRTIISLDAIPVNSRGKISRAELAQRFGGA